jgi:hypothetical protein
MEQAKLAQASAAHVKRFPSPPRGGNGISTARLAGVEVDAAVTADGGAPLRDIIDDAAGGALVAAPYWEGVSVDGAHSSPHTGSHGSSWWGSQARRARRRG